MKINVNETAIKKRAFCFIKRAGAYFSVFCFLLSAISFTACAPKNPGLNASSEDSFALSKPAEEGGSSPGDAQSTSFAEGSFDPEESGVLPVENPFIYNFSFLREKLGENFSVTYEITRYLADFSTEKSTVVFAKDETGYYIDMDSVSYLYIKDGEGYFICAEDDIAGVYVKIPGVLVSAEEVESMFLGALSPFFYDARQKGLKSAGPAFVCGRRCEKYLLDAAVRRAETDMEFFIDTDLELCLKYACFSPETGENGGIDYECADLRLSGVTLPPYEE